MWRSALTSVVSLLEDPCGHGPKYSLFPILIDFSLAYFALYRLVSLLFKDLYENVPTEIPCLPFTGCRTGNNVSFHLNCRKTLLLVAPWGHWEQMWCFYVLIKATFLCPGTHTEGGGGKACLPNFDKSSRILFQNIWWTVPQSLHVSINNAASTVCWDPFWSSFCCETYSLDNFCGGWIFVWVVVCLVGCLSRCLG